MQLQGREEIAAARERVWQMLIDPRQVAPCVPGQPDIEIVDDRHFRVKVSIGGGFLRTKATIDIVVASLDAPAHATATATASAMGGGVNATTNLELTELGPRSTAVEWVADVSLSGMLSGFAGMAEGPARDGIARTIACMKTRLEASEPDAASAAD